MAARILITGSNGFLGRTLLSKLLLSKDEIVSLERTPRSESSTKVYTSVTDLINYERSFEIIYHLAAYIPDGDIDAVKLESVNVELTSKLCNAYPTARFVFASSVSVYGVPTEKLISINSPFNNPGIYGQSKIDAESIVKTMNRYAIIRFSSIVGVGMSRLTFVNRVIRDAKKGSIVIFGQGLRKQNYIDVHDATMLMILAAKDRHNLILNGIALRSWSNLEIAQLVSDITGSPIEFRAEDDCRSFEYEVGETYKNINFVPSVTIEQTLREIINHE